MSKYSIECHGLTLYSSDSVLDCFHYFKKSIENMPKAYMDCNLIINDDSPVSPVPVSSALSSPAPIVPGVNGEIHIHIHIGDK